VFVNTGEVCLQSYLPNILGLNNNPTWLDGGKLLSLAAGKLVFSCSGLFKKKISKEVLYQKHSQQLE